MARAGDWIASSAVAELLSGHRFPQQRWKTDIRTVETLCALVGNICLTHSQVCTYKSLGHSCGNLSVADGWLARWALAAVRRGESGRCGQLPASTPVLTWMECVASAASPAAVRQDFHTSGEIRVKGCGNPVYTCWKRLCNLHVWKYFRPRSNSVWKSLR